MPAMECSLVQLVRWRPEYAIGVEEVDSDHQHLFALIDSFATAIRQGREHDRLFSLMEELLDYTCYHFAHEELLMEQIGYPHFEEHRLEHEGIRKTLHTMKAQAAGGGGSIAEKLMNFLFSWLRQHTMTSDRRIGTHMKKYGLSV
jgi:hemerythrin-like metal-binding protein